MSRSYRAMLFTLIMSFFYQPTRKKNYIVRLSENEKEMSGGAEKKYENSRSW
jgi:hypothetical protein